MLQSSRLKNAELSALVADAALIETDSYGPKVYRLANGEYLKLFRRKRLLSSALFVPYSVRFCRNAAQLRNHNIPTVTPLELYQLEDSAWTAVRYQALCGQTLKDLSKHGADAEYAYLPQLIELFHRLHSKGIYFRSLHLGNIVLTPEQRLGLIDIADLCFQRRAISKSKARRNLAHFERYLRHEGLLESFPYQQLYSAVLELPIA